jgi:predicted aspartyl protease
MPAAVVTLLLSAIFSQAVADDIDGVQPAAMDQPRINVVIRRQLHGQPLIGKTSDGDAFNVEAFLDTGASSVALSPNTAQLLGIQREMAAQQEARFEDVGVGGGSEFAVSEPIFLSLAPMAPNVDVEQ